MSWRVGIEGIVEGREEGSVKGSVEGSEGLGVDGNMG